MKKEILKLGEGLNKKELKSLHGGFLGCPPGKTPPPACGGSGCIEPYHQPECEALGLYIWHENSCWSCGTGCCS